MTGAIELREPQHGESIRHMLEYISKELGCSFELHYKGKRKVTEGKSGLNHLTLIDFQAGGKVFHLSLDEDSEGIPRYKTIKQQFRGRQGNDEEFFERFRILAEGYLEGCPTRREEENARGYLNYE